MPILSSPDSPDDPDFREVLTTDGFMILVSPDDLGWITLYEWSLTLGDQDLQGGYAPSAACAEFCARLAHREYAPRFATLAAN